MMNKNAAYASIKDLVNRFEEQIASYKKNDYNETLARRDFIDPFFKALGWDVDNSQGYAEAYREVIHEDKIKVAGQTKAPDYSFRLPGGKRLFFVEAKKPSVIVKQDILPAYQIRRYAWSAKMPISILTDFEELSIYDCNKKPKADDKASVGRIKYLTYKEYLTEFDFLWETFSKERVLKGSFDKYIASDKSKKGTTTVDKEFLASLDEWRKLLAVNIALRNESYSEDDLNFVVQQLIDRIIFLRIAEDRNVEEYGRLQSLLKSDNYYQNMFGYFKEADSKYNSGLFDFKKDRLSQNLLLDNKILKTIITELYYPVSPYEFSVLSVEILGSAYEQFLGKQIKLTSGHRAIIEEKPEVRKAGGVYYTPQYIVDYIVDRTIGTLTKNKKPAEIAKLTILDPACGSGSFLLGAYQYLIDWHRDYFKPEFDRLTAISTSTDYTIKERNDAIKERNKLPLTPDGHLTTALKKEILLNNIFGVDIDLQAVEVTKLSLLLKCMEGETGSSINAELRFGERVLPTLDNNIRCGNSLVDTDFFDGKLDFEPTTEKKANPFSWQNAFPKVFKEGGFSAVIGNPPYIRIQSIIDNAPEQGLYFSKTYQSAGKGNYDIYVIFIEKALALINEGGKIGFILPHKFFTAQYGEAVRDLLSETKAIDAIVHFGHQQIFDSATTYTCILTLDKNKKKKDIQFTRVDNLEDWRNAEKKEFQKIAYKDLQNGEWNFISGNDQALLSKLSSIKDTLETTTDRIFQGLKTGADKVFIVRLIKETNTHFTVYSSQLEAEFKLEKDLVHPLIKGGDSRNYIMAKSNLVIIFPYRGNPIGKVSLIPEPIVKKEYPLIYNYLNENKKLLQSRDNGKMKEDSWYGYSRNQALDVIKTPKLFTPDISPAASYSIDENGDIFFTGGVSGGYGIKVRKGLNEYYLLGLLNSKLLDWFLKSTSTQMRGGWYSYEAKYIKHLPVIIPTPANKGLVESIIGYVKSMIKLQKEKQETTLPHQLGLLDQKINHIQNSIDKIVYQLYNLEAGEIEVIEKAVIL